jgi:hypothetical protein
MPRALAARARRSSKVANSAGPASSAVSNTQQSGIRSPVCARISANCPAAVARQIGRADPQLVQDVFNRPSTARAGRDHQHFGEAQHVHGLSLTGQAREQHRGASVVDVRRVPMVE